MDGPFDTIQERTYTGGMEVRLSPDKQARLQEIATRAGKNAEQMVEEAVDRMLEHLEHDERFVAAVEEGRSSARRGELLEHVEVVERIETILRSSADDGDAREVDAFNQMIRKLRGQSLPA